MVAETKELSDLLNSGDKEPKQENNSNIPFEDENGKGPPDGGIRAYMVLVGSFLTNGLLFGVMNSYSVIHTVLLEQLVADDVPNAEVWAPLVGVLTMGTTFLLSPLSGLLTGFLGLRLTAVLGGSLAAAGLLLSSFVTNNVGALCFTYGIMYGLGASLAYTPSLAILGHYFKKYLGIVNGVVTIGSSVFTVCMPPLMEYMIKNHGLQWMFTVLAAITLGIAFCGLLFKPIPVIVLQKPLPNDNNLKSLLRTIGSIFKNKSYRLWAISMPVALFGYYVPYVHIKDFIKELNFRDINDNLPLQSLAITSGIGRLSFGFLADRPGVDRLMLQQISFYVIGALTILLPFVGSFWLLVVVCLGMGLFEGGFIALIGPIAVELCGAAYAAPAIGCVLGIAAIPISVGPPVAGSLHRHLQSYTIPFALAGISPLFGATLMFLLRCQRRRGNQATETRANGHIFSSNNDIEKRATPLLSMNGDAINQETGS